MMKKVAFYTTVIFVIFCVIVLVPALQILPIALAGLLLGMSIFGKKDIKVWILVLSVVMFFLNLSMLSFIDILYWLWIFVIFVRE